MAEIDKERFGEFVAQLRKEKGFTQQELADRLFVSNKAVSKWERGQSLPDIGLLEPLADILGVTVTELLRGERLGEKSLDSREVEELVTAAARLSAQEEKGQRRGRSFWRQAWGVCALLAVLETAALSVLGFTLSVLLDGILMVEGLMLGFGFYFCFLAKEKLPAFYDENKLSFYSDGPLRMNLPGVRFNNSNWPHIVSAARGWMLAVAVVFPVLYAAAWALLPASLWRGGASVALQLTGALSFFIPIIVVGKKYE